MTLKSQKKPVKRHVEDPKLHNWLCLIGCASRLGDELGTNSSNYRAKP